MKPTIQRVAVIWLALNLFYGQSFSDQTGGTLHSTASTRVVYQARQILSNLRSTRYSHRSMVDEKTGTYRLDCSALAAYLLGAASPCALDAVAADTGHPRRAKNFHDAIAIAPLDRTGPGWQRIPSLLAARPGDFIVWRKNPMPPKGDTGHIMVLMEKPVPENRPLVRVVVLDASRSRHARDTRKPKESGVGMGTMWFRVDASGAPLAMHWSDPQAPPKAYPTVIGRVVDQP